MTKYSVYLPIAGYISTSVEAESEEEAIAKALDKSYETSDIEEWSPYRALIKAIAASL